MKSQRTILENINRILLLSELFKEQLDTPLSTNHPPRLSIRSSASLLYSILAQHGLKTKVVQDESEYAMKRKRTRL